jgi:phage N-6-adenine-methyltransferase
MSEIRKDNIATLKGDWGTPDKLYRHLDNEFHFDADAAANSQNTKHPVYFTKSMDSLSFSWRDMIDFKPTDQKPRPAFFLNPDYAKGIVDKFVAKARTETRESGSVVVCLVPVVPDTNWFQDSVLEYDGRVAVEIRFIKGRVGYVGYTKDGKIISQKPTFPSCIVIFSLSHPHYWNQDYDPVMPIVGKTIVMKDLK